TKTRAAAGVSASARGTRSPKLKQRFRDSMTSNSRGGGSPGAKPSRGWPVPAASRVVAWTALVAMAVVMVMEVVVVVRIEKLTKADSHDPSASISQPTHTPPFLRLGIGAG